MSVTYEQMRADIAEALDMAPEKLADDANLYDLGLDSMRVMTLALRWQDEGCEMDYGVLAENQTLAAWWQEAARQQAEA